MSAEMGDEARRKLMAKCNETLDQFQLPSVEEFRAIQRKCVPTPGPDESEAPCRAETGPMQFGDDWPGVFIRGDNAANYANTLDWLLRSIPEADRGIDWMQTQGLVSDLRSSTVGSPDVPSIQLMRAFDKARAKP